MTIERILGILLLVSGIIHFIEVVVIFNQLMTRGVLRDQCDVANRALNHLQSQVVHYKAEAERYLAMATLLHEELSNANNRES